jgi:hypothetical protein
MNRRKADLLNVLAVHDEVKLAKARTGMYVNAATL